VAQRAGWTGVEVFLPVPGFVSGREVRAAAAEAGARRPRALGVRLETIAGDAAPEHPGRDRLPGKLRATRSGRVPQHRARELR
jgi:hypothetical protein